MGDFYFNLFFFLTPSIFLFFFTKNNLLVKCKFMFIEKYVVKYVMARKNKERKLIHDRYTVTRIDYVQEYPFDVFPTNESDGLRIRTIKARSLSEAIKRYLKSTTTEFNFEINSKSAIGYSKEIDQGRWTDEDWEKHCALHNIYCGLSNLFQLHHYPKENPSYYVEATSVVTITKTENQIMKSDYIKSDSKLRKWIHKRFVKYADQLGVSVPTYYINRRDIVERMGEYAVAKTSDCTCIGRCWYGSGIIWIDVNYHDKKWGSDKKAFRKNIDHTIAHEMVHLRFHSRSDPLHVRHDGSKQRRAFDRRTNQVVRGKRYD